MITESRILGEKISRIFVSVEVSVNPFTGKLLQEKHLAFADDPEIQSFLEHAEFRGQNFGYVSCAYIAEMRDSSSLEKARVRLVECENMIIRMHKFVLDTLNDPMV